MNEQEPQDGQSPVAQSGLNVGLGLPKFCTVKDMNYTGEIIHGEFDGTHYVLEDGDAYLSEYLVDHYDAVLLDDDPRVPSVQANSAALAQSGGAKRNES